jgi:hypothetical protein
MTQIVAATQNKKTAVIDQQKFTAEIRTCCAVNVTIAWLRGAWMTEIRRMLRSKSRTARA